MTSRSQNLRAIKNISAAEASFGSSFKSLDTLFGGVAHRLHNAFWEPRVSAKASMLTLENLSPRALSGLPTLPATACANSSDAQGSAKDATYSATQASSLRPQTLRARSLRHRLLACYLALCQKRRLQQLLLRGAQDLALELRRQVARRPAAPVPKAAPRIERPARPPAMLREASASRCNSSGYCAANFVAALKPGRFSPFLRTLGKRNQQAPSSQLAGLRSQLP